MGEIAEAKLFDGRRLPYVIVSNPPRGGIKHTYFAPDYSYVVQFFNDPAHGENPYLLKRLQAIVGPYNPTLAESDGGAVGNDLQTANYYAKLFCWPIGLVQEPQLGVVCPTYKRNFFFESNASYEYNLQGEDKRSTWFTTERRSFLARAELGNFKSMLEISLLLARGVRRLHQAGLAHSDLSHNNVLIDPKTGTCAIIDIDSLVVPGIFPPEVIGTPGYIAPEVLTAAVLPKDQRPESFGTARDLHALAVLIYQYLLCRHPLVGQKIYCEESGEEDDFLTFGPKATFVEDPVDESNRPAKLKATIYDLGLDLANLFLRAFVDGLHKPDLRPTAMEWELGLSKTLELLEPCNNLPCEQKWFVLQDIEKPICPFCGSKITKKTIIRFKFKTQLYNQAGHWQDVRECNISQDFPIYPWHVYSNVYVNEKTAPVELARVHQVGENWLFLNKAIRGLVSPSGSVVPRGGSFILEDGAMFRIAQEPKGFLVEVVIKKQ